MVDLTELDELEQYLKDNGYNYKRIDHDPHFPAEFHQIQVLKDGAYSWDVICHPYSYGHQDGLLEAMGDIVRDKTDNVEGWLTAETIIARLQK